MLVFMIHENRCSDHIHIEALEVFARVGVPDEERVSAQRLTFNITFWPAHPKPALEDEVARTVDYSAVCAETKRFVQARSDRLIETLADALAMRLLEIFAMQKITIELRKFILREVEFVSVTVTRDRSPK
jgi:dihydroneopterin aldolase